MTTGALTVAQVANRYAVDVHSVLAWIRSGDLKAFNVGRSKGKKRPRWRISQEAIELFEESRTRLSITKQRRSRLAQQQINSVIAFY